MGKGIYIVPSRTNTIELQEFVDVLALISTRNSLEKMLPQLSKGIEIAVHLEDVSLNSKERSYLLNGRFETNVQSIAEQVGRNYDVRYGIQPVSRNGMICSIKNYAVIKKRR